MISDIRAASDDLSPQIVAWRRHLHQRPELAFEEHATAAFVAEKLGALGLEVRTGIGRTGVVADLRGTAPGAENGPCVALRADMDALPIHEATGLGFASAHPGVMHACGHDAHTAALLGAAHVLTGLREHLRGSVRFLFQPSEERIPGGAPGMIADGALDGVDTVFGQHVRPDLPTGIIAARGGAFMAAADIVTLVVRGQGGHAAEPHRSRADAIVTAAHVVTALQTVVSRNRPPGEPGVVSFGSIHGGSAPNVLPETITLEGTLRAMDEVWRERQRAFVERVAKGTAAALGAECEVTWALGYPPLVNDTREAAFVRRAAEDFVGADRSCEADLWFAGEDFAYYLRERPGCFYVVGTGSSEATRHGLHTPQFTIDEAALSTMSGFLATLALKRLRSG